MLTPSPFVRVSIPNEPVAHFLLRGSTSLGAVITSLNVIHNVAELSYQLIDSGAKVVLVTSETTPALVRAAEKAGITRIWRLDEVREGAKSGDADAYLATTFDARDRDATHEAHFTRTARVE